MLGYFKRSKDSTEVFVHKLQQNSIQFCQAVLTYSRNLNQQPFSDVAIKAVHLACHRSLVWEVKRKRKKWEMDLRWKNGKSFCFFLSCLPSWSVARTHRRWSLVSHFTLWSWVCCCPGNIPLAAGWAVLGLLPVRGLCCDCALVWIMGSVLSCAWLLGRAHVQRLDISLPLSRAVQKCWRSWQLYRYAGIPTVVCTASQGSAEHLWTTESPCQVSGNTHILHWSEQVTPSSCIFSEPILVKSGEQNILMRHVCLTWHTTLLAIGWTDQE